MHIFLLFLVLSRPADSFSLISLGFEITKPSPDSPLLNNSFSSKNNVIVLNYLRFVWYLKLRYVVLGKYILIRRERSLLTADQTNVFMTMNFSFIFGGPCHLSSVTELLGEQLVYSVMEKKIFLICITVSFILWVLEFFSKFEFLLQNHIVPLQFNVSAIYSWLFYLQTVSQLYFSSNLVLKIN